MDKKEVESLKSELKRQLKVANRMALPREKWEDNMGYVGAYHLGRKEALESIANKIDIRLVHEVAKELGEEKDG